MAPDGRLWEAGADFGTGPQTPASSNRDLFVAKLDATGTLRWVNLATSTQNFGKVAEEVAVGPDGTIGLTARAVGDVDFGLGPDSGVLNNDIYFALFAP